MDLLQNPFYILTASPRDNRRRIMELADERSLLLDSSECMEARSDLTNPRKRLSAEVAWLPGIGPKRVGELLSFLETSPRDLLATDKLSPIARANLLAAGLVRIPDHKAKDIAAWIVGIAKIFEEMDIEELSNIINEERVVSGFPEVSDISAVEAEIQERRIHYQRVIKSALDNLPSKDLVEAVTVAVESATNDGKEHGPVLIADVVDSYEVEAQEFLDKEEKTIGVLVDKLRSAVDAERSDSTLAPMVNQLIQVVKNWDTVAQPIQVSAKSRGLDHDASHRVARLVRDLAIHIYNEHDKLGFSQQLTKMLQEVFAEVGEVAEQTAEDTEALDAIEEQRKLSHLLDPISDLCSEVIENVKNDPSSVVREAQRIIDEVPTMLRKLSESKPSREVLFQGKDTIALTLMHCAIVHSNNSQKWKTCVIILEQAYKYSGSQEIKSKIEDNLSTARDNLRLYGDLKPISSAPSLSSINGIGKTLYGSTDYDPASGSYISTYYFIVLGIPVFPLCRYRVIRTGERYQFLGKAPLRTFDKWHIAISLGIIGWILLSMLSK